jgi:transposase
MARVSTVKPHLTEAEIKEKIATAPTPRCQQKWMIIHNALVEPRTALAIAKHTATSLRTVRQVIADYNREGAAAIRVRKKAEKNPRAYLSYEEESAFLASFDERAKNGHLTTIQSIQTAFEAKVGMPVAPSTIYRLLERHQWRKLAPRPYHPEGDKAARETFKQTSRN